MVDDALRERLLRPGILEVAACRRTATIRQPALVDLRALERSREQLQLREGDVLVDALEDTVDVGARLDELRRQPQRLRGRVRVLEAPRVGDDRDVERLGDRRGDQLDVELGEQVAEDLARRRGVPDDEVEAPEAGVVVVVVDVDDERRALEEGGSGPSRRSFAQSSAITTRLAGVRRELTPKLAEAMKSYSAGSGTVPNRYMTASFPSWSNASFAASNEPSASPSGFSCVVRRNRSWARIASTIL